MLFNEALSTEDQKDILDLEQDIVRLKMDLVDAQTDEEKEDLKQRIDDLKTDIQSIKDNAVEESLQEKYATSLNVRAWGGSAFVEIFKNPTSQEISEAFREDLVAKEYDELRGIATEDGDVYITVIRDTELIHDSILKTLDDAGLEDYVSSWETKSIGSYTKYLAIVIYRSGMFKISEGSHSPQNLPTNYENIVLSIQKKMRHLEFMEPEDDMYSDDWADDDEYYDDEDSFDGEDWFNESLTEEYFMMDRGKYSGDYSLYKNPDSDEWVEASKGQVIVRGVLLKDGTLYIAAEENFGYPIHSDLLSSLGNQGVIPEQEYMRWHRDPDNFELYECVVALGGGRLKSPQYLYLSESYPNDLVSKFVDEYLEDYEAALQELNPRFRLAPERMSV